MGRLYDDDLRHPDPPPHGAPRYVSSIPAAQSATATPVTWQGNQWDYSEPEESIHLRLNRWVDISATHGECHYWSGIEVTIPSERLRELSPGQRLFLVAALYPASVNWFAYAPFLRAYNRKDRLEKIRAAADLRSLPWDPIQTNSAFYTARLDDPRRLDYDRGLDLGSGYLLSRHPIAIANKQVDRTLVWRFGLVPEKCLQSFNPIDTGIWMALAGRAEGDNISLQQAIESWR